VTPIPIHIRPTAPLARRALLPGDPGRALALAQVLLDDPRMFNHHRGLWGYTGAAGDGELLTIQSTGMGGPSAAIVLHELIELGLERGIRVGSCGALVDELALGDVLVVGEAIAQDGTSRALGAGERTRSDAGLCAALERAARCDATTIVSTDLFYEPREGREAEWVAQGARAVEMEAAALFEVGRRAGVAIGCVLAVSDALAGGRRRIDDAALAVAGARIGHIATAALGDL
jgi:uridine phosphorylase